MILRFPFLKWKETNGVVYLISYISSKMTSFIIDTMCQEILSNMEQSFNQAISLFHNLQKQQSKESQTWLRSFHSAFSNMQNQLRRATSSFDNGNNAEDALSMNQTNINSTTLIMNSTIPENASILSSTIDLSKTLEAYSNMLVDMVKQKLNSSKVGL
jgi:uncharacterized protein YukE